ncbi:glycosyltransferase family 2 protein [Halosegnis marinus]|uniref:Glycosyltransferase family 2 protein n=1 Tax=Halosegnis marinus TaxID=3034023 RepID=A0ABD5ZPT4_9EURY|nr:glycosyltransferase family 2 protein [Halosegnis sp. DT85]
MLSLSVVTICYNCLEELPGTVGSVRGQTYDEIEHVVIDGDSDDGTSEWLAEREEWFDVLVSEQDDGRYHAMNKGLERATGDYVLFLNAGDEFRTDSVIEDLFTRPEIRENRPNIISGRIELTIDGESLNFTRPWRSGKEGPGLPHPATLVDRELHQQYSFDEQFTYVADYELWARLRDERAYDVHYVSDVITLFNVEGASNSPDVAFARYLERAFVDYKYGHGFDSTDAAILFLAPIARQMLSLLLGQRRFIAILRYRRLAKRLLRNGPKL